VARTTRGVLITVTLVTLSFVDSVAQLRPEPIERGGEWLSWTAGERSRYVYGFVSGYLQGRIKACNAADDLFEVGQPHRLGDEQHPTEIPSGRCLARVEFLSRCTFTNSSPDCSPYTSAITEFYTKHAEYLGIPFPFLIEFLSDGKCATAEQLYQKASKGEIRPVR
jgi:hypothetical protein